MNHPHAFGASMVVALVAAATLAPAAAPKSYSVDPARSRATIQVGKSGPLSFAAGHTHEVVANRITGQMRIDPVDVAQSTVRVTIDASRLTVTGKGESADDVPKVQATMDGEEVLDVKRHPTIAFESTSVSVKRKTADAIETIVSGKLTLHGVTRQISVPVTARVNAEGVSASGQFPVKQTDYGIKPVSVGGVVSVKDTVTIAFTVVGR
jgi:polyisoprenoid-binding protein YceI